MDEALVLCRLLQFAAAMLLFGISIFQSFLAPQALARPRPSAAASSRGRVCGRFGHDDCLAIASRWHDG